uniref:Uncharacterized protein n=1 Tax=Astyanax mexicanus TaxID=7994 RepID=A0A8B9HZG5_ASTMX
MLHVFDAVLSLFGKDIEKNIVIFATHSDGSPPVNAINAIKKAGIPCRKENGTDPIHFTFNNCQAEQKMTVGQRVYRFAWELTEDNLNDFFASMENQSRKSLEKTQSVLTEQIQLKACVSNLRERIEIKEHKHEELTQIQEALKENQEKIQKNEDFSFTNCHESNYWGSINSAWCKVMKDGHCTVCTGKCHHSKHIRENKKYVMNKKLENTKKEEMEKISIENRLQITLKPDSAFIVETLDFLIPRAEEVEYPEWVQELKRLREIQPEAEERASSVQRYCRAGFKKVTSFLSGRK